MMFNDRRKAKPTAAPAMSADRKSYKVSNSVTVKPGDPKKLGTGGPLTNDRLGFGAKGPRALDGAAQAARENNLAAPISKKEAKANKRGLKAAQGSSLAPKGYKSDTAGRKVVRDEASPITDKNMNVVSRKKRYNDAAIRVDNSGAANKNDPWTSKNDNVRRK